jgi:uncharacterized protein YbcI
VGDERLGPVVVDDPAPQQVADVGGQAVDGLEDALSQAERSLVADGREEAVHHVRRELQQAMQPELVDAIERLTGCEVAAFMSATHIDPDIGAELFVLDEPVPTGEPPPAGRTPTARPRDASSSSGRRPAQGRSIGARCGRRSRRRGSSWSPAEARGSGGR